jgi:Bacteriophage baseplate protein W
MANTDFPIFATPPKTPPAAYTPPPPPVAPVYGELSDVGANWRVKFYDADGIPLNMLSFEVIDFGAIAYKEIFQNVKTILATPLFSAALERLLGVDQSIVDLPIDEASQATVAILDALYFWEPRAEPTNIQFDADVIAGHLICTLQLRIKNVIFGTETPYDRNNIFGTPTVVSQSLPPMEVPPTVKEIPGPKGDTGQRGSIWFIDTVNPDTSTKIVNPLPNDVFLNSTTGDVFQYVVATPTGRAVWQKVSP